jgi:hypothetical protein
MTWTKIGDEFADHCWRLSDAAFRLHVEGLVWSNRKHLDGRLSKGEPWSWTRCPEAVTELVTKNWWEDCGDDYLILNHMGWQRTAEQWFHQSRVNTSNGRKGGRPRKPKTESLTELETESKSEPKAKGTGLVWSGQGLEKEPNYVSANEENDDAGLSW